MRITRKSRVGLGRVGLGRVGPQTSEGANEQTSEQGGRIDNTQQPTTWSDAFLAQGGVDFYDDDDDNDEDNNDDDNHITTTMTTTRTMMTASFFDTTTNLGLMHIISMMFQSLSAVSM